MRKFFDKLGTTILFFFAYIVCGARTYMMFTKWTGYNDSVVPFSTVILAKDVDIHSGDAMRSAIDQSPFFQSMQNSFQYDHLEPCPVSDYLEDIWLF